MGKLPSLILSQEALGLDLEPEKSLTLKIVRSNLKNNLLQSIKIKFKSLLEASELLVLSHLAILSLEIYSKVKKVTKK